MQEIEDSLHDTAPLAKKSDPLGRRKLLLVYIHGFMGDESSFRSFPAHVHSLLTVLIQDTHVVYSKIYPRYRSKKYITIARDDFSTWLEPHESSDTDVVLLGHSMGGLVAAEVALMPTPDSIRPKHRILGTINFDVPFLGMHPGVVSSGLASIFMPAGEAPMDKYVVDEGNASTEDVLATKPLKQNDTFWEPPQGDQRFNAKFNNDVVLPVRKFWQGIQHFVHKHGSDLTTATSRLISSHVEFMSAMSNATELRSRYTKLRLLEEDNESVRKSVSTTSSTPERVRFVNYYTASTGRPKAEKQSDEKPEENAATDEAAADMLKASTEVNGTTTEEQEDPPIADPETLATNESKASRPPKDRKFCNLPPKDSSGERDPTWVRIYMKDVDEVGAHCGMFFVDGRYERLVADVAERIETWSIEDLSVRLARESNDASNVTAQEKRR
ncbi:hypothetical protein AMS68_001029 [Peltaster fructicola]|uniref:AB hydrolase-1 domain-containing protein n=1 Tax=Peltaster fructicola TaxID=286661 RepID=A0A6H0XL88_9PEZI|nr:hypothetical protein AMS68_001029 [Peltaster fructicola]